MSRSWLTDVAADDDPAFVALAQQLGPVLPNAYLIRVPLLAVVAGGRAIGWTLRRRNVANVAGVAAVVGEQVRQAVMQGARDV